MAKKGGLCRRRETKSSRKARVNSGADPSAPPPTPQGPNHWLHPEKRVPICSFSNSASSGILIKSCRVMGQKLRCGRPGTHDLPSTHKWLKSPHTASTSSESHWNHDGAAASDPYHSRCNYLHTARWCLKRAWPEVCIAA